MPRLQFYADEPLCERLSSIAQKRDISVSQLIVEILTNTDIESTLSAPDSFPNQMAEVLEALANYVDLCEKDPAKSRVFALREAIPDFQTKYPMFIKQDGKKVRNSMAGRIGRQFYNLVNKGLVPNIKSTGMLDRNRTALYEVVLKTD